MRCEECKWWQRLKVEDDESGESGFCCRRSPTVFRGQLFNNKAGWEWSDRQEGCWPVTLQDTWCGEFAASYKAITDLNLSVRVRNCLSWNEKRGGKRIRTVEELANITDLEFRNMKGFGQTCLREVRRKIADIKKCL